jgi:hypothetical protein
VRCQYGKGLDVLASKESITATIALEADDEILVARLLDRGKHQEELTIKMRKN